MKYEEVSAMPTSTQAEAIARLQAAETNRDFDTPHILADETLCDFLRSLGYGDVVDVYCNLKIPWYYA